jgi:hypothetical protein
VVTIPDGLIPIVFDAGEIIHGVKIERALQQSDAIMWAVRNSCNQCLDHCGNWDYEWQPSDRTPAYIHRCRFATLQDAYDALIKYRDSLISNGWHHEPATL